MEPFERLWALACVAAGKSGHDGAADGLRGVSYAERSYHEFAANGKRVTCDFPLLKYQSRTGAVGTYWTAIVGGQLVHPDTGALAAEGQELAGHFPELPLDAKDRARFADPETARPRVPATRRTGRVGRRAPILALPVATSVSSLARPSPPTIAVSA